VLYLYTVGLPWKFMQQAIRCNNAGAIDEVTRLSFSWFATGRKLNYKALVVLGTGYRKTLSQEMKSIMDRQRCIAETKNPGACIGADAYCERINLSIAKQTQGKLKQTNANKLVTQAAKRQNAYGTLIPEIKKCMHIGGAQRESSGSRVRHADVDTLVAAFKEKLGRNWTEFRNSTTSFYEFDPSEVVNRYKKWQHSKQAEDYILKKLEDYKIE